MTFRDGLSQPFAGRVAKRTQIDDMRTREPQCSRAPCERFQLSCGGGQSGKMFRTVVGNARVTRATRLLHRRHTCHDQVGLTFT